MPTWNEAEKQKIKSLVEGVKLTKDVSYYRKVVIPKIVNNKARYKAMAELFKCPLAFIPLIHCKESASDLGRFQTYLGNGQPLNKKTTIVPKGRGPFSSWEAGVIDAFTLEGIAKITDWSLERMIYELEGYNGYGYRSKGVNSPYIWNYTNRYTKGHYVADGKYDANAVAGNIGCFALYMLLCEADSDFIFGAVTAGVDTDSQTPVKNEEMPPIAETETPKWFDPFKEIIQKILKWIFGDEKEPTAIATEEPMQQSTLDRILAANKGLNPHMVKQALAWFDHSAIKNKQFMVLVDFNIVERLKRMFVVDMSTFKAVGYKVAHGSKSDPNKDGKTDSFSNVSGSNKSSLGAMVMTKQYGHANKKGGSKFPWACVIEGLEKGLNDNVRSRAIVFHSSKYVNDTEKQAIGDSLGCFAVSEKTAQSIIDKIDEGCLLYSYHESIRKQS